MRDEAPTMGRLLSSFEEFEPETMAQEPFSLREVTFTNIPRAKEARDERASKIEDFGRTW